MTMVQKCSLMLVISILALCTSSYGQNEVRKDRGQTQVFIGFESKTEKDVLLRLKNNSGAPIKVCVQKFTIPAPVNQTKITLSNGENKYAFVDEKHIEICFGVEKYKTEKIVLSKGGNNFSKEKNTEKSGLEECKNSYCGFYLADRAYEGWIENWNSVLFKVPIKFLKEDHRIYVKYNYEWEENAGGSPTHIVYFNSASIPK